MTTTHLQARAILVAAWPIALGHRERTLMATQCIQAMMYMESGYGDWWHGNLKGSNNWGAVHANARQLPDGSPPPGTAWGDETRPPTEPGASSYPQLFRTYPTPLDGCVDVLRWFAHHFECLDEADSGICLRFSTALRAVPYYEGKGATRYAQIHNHAGGIYNHAHNIAFALSEPFCLAMGEAIAV